MPIGQELGREAARETLFHVGLEADRLFGGRTGKRGACEGGRQRGDKDEFFKELQAVDSNTFKRCRSGTFSMTPLYAIGFHLASKERGNARVISLVESGSGGAYQP